MGKYCRFARIALTLLMCAAPQAFSQENGGATPGGSVLAPAPPAAPPNLDQHPLTPALLFAKNRYDYVHKNLRDFSCLLIRRERINGRLRDYEYIRTKARLRPAGSDTGLSVYMQFLGPAKYKGRKILFIEGQNDGKMLIRNGGARFSYITVKIAPDSEAATAESRHPITELSLGNLARRMIEKVEEDIRDDPSGENTKLNFFINARVEDRPCTHIQVVHPVRDPNLTFHIADVYVDDELHVPIRVEGYDWPEQGGGEPPLLEEYTFTRLELNVGLTDGDFDSSQVGR